MPTLSPPIVVPFAMRFDHIMLDARVNGVPATLALDTGCGAIGLDAEWASGLGLTPGPASRALGSDTLRIDAATVDTILLGGDVELRNEMAALVPLGDVNARRGSTMHGLVGFPLFARYVVEVDYAARVLRLHDPATFSYSGPGTGIAIEVSKRAPILHAALTTRNGASIPVRLLVDLGTGGYGAILTKPFVDQHADALYAGPFIERVIGSGVGGPIHGRVAMLRTLELGGLRVPNPIVAMPADGRGFFGASWVDGSLGAPILRRSALFIDYPHSQLIIEPAADWEEPFAFDVSGLALQAGGAALEQVEIEGVTPGSAASAVGLTAGEIVLAVDSHPVSAASMESIAELFKRVGATHTLRVERGGEVRDVLLRLESNGLG